MTTLPRLTLLSLVIVSVTAIGSAGVLARHRSGPPIAAMVADTSPVVTLDVPGRSDATPSVAAIGDVVVVAWGASLDGKADVFAAVSRDAGRTFGPPVQVNRVAGEGRLGGELPPRVALVPGTSGRDPEIVVLWNARGTATTIKSARSLDGGRTFGVPVVLQADGAAGDRGWPALTVDSAGVVHAIWLDHRGLAARRAAAGAAGATRGATPAAGHHAHAGTGERVDGAITAKGSSLYHAAWGSIVTLEHEVTSGVCYCCKTALAAGPAGTVYAAWRHVYEGDLRDIAMTVSPDGGRSFSAPSRVSEDGWAINGCPDDGPAVVVEATGTAHIVWPTVIGHAEPEGALFYATTRDGRQFTPRVRVPTLGSPKPMHPQITLGPDGRVVVAWDELWQGRRVAAMRAVTRAGDGEVRFGEVVRIGADGSASHPVVTPVTGGVLAVSATGGDVSRIEARRLVVP